MGASQTSSTKVASVGTRRLPRRAKPAQTAPPINPLGPPAAIELALPFAASRRKLLPRNYVPPYPRNASSIFAHHFFSEAKKALTTRSTDAILRKAYKLWLSFSDAEKLPYEMLAKAEMDLHKMRFPEDRVPEKPARRTYKLQWSVANDHLFVIDTEGAIQYKPAPVDNAPILVPFETDGQNYMGVVDYTCVSYPLFSPEAKNNRFSLEAVDGVDCSPPQLSHDDDELMDVDHPASDLDTDYDLSPLVVPGFRVLPQLDEVLGAAQEVQDKAIGDISMVAWFSREARVSRRDISRHSAYGSALAGEGPLEVECLQNPVSLPCKSKQRLLT